MHWGKAWELGVIVPHNRSTLIPTAAPTGPTVLIVILQNGIVITGKGCTNALSNLGAVLFSDM